LEPARLKGTDEEEKRWHSKEKAAWRR
jgi:hypothetical protein